MMKYLYWPYWAYWVYWPVCGRCGRWLPCCTFGGKSHGHRQRWRTERSASVIGSCLCSAGRCHPCCGAVRRVERRGGVSGWWTGDGRVWCCALACLCLSCLQGGGGSVLLGWGFAVKVHHAKEIPLVQAWLRSLQRLGSLSNSWLGSFLAYQYQTYSYKYSFVCCFLILRNLDSHSSMLVYTLILA